MHGYFKHRSSSAELDESVFKVRGMIPSRAWLTKVGVYVYFLLINLWGKKSEGSKVFLWHEIDSLLRCPFYSRCPFYPCILADGAAGQQQNLAA